MKSGSISIGTLPSTPLMIEAVWRVRMSEPVDDHADAQVHLLDLLGEQVGLVAADVHQRQVEVAAAAEAAEVGLRHAVADEVEGERAVGLVRHVGYAGVAPRRAPEEWPSHRCKR